MNTSNTFKRVSPLAVGAECKNIAANKFGYGFVAITNCQVVAPKKTAAEWFGKFGSDFASVKKITKVLNARCYDYERAVNRTLAKNGSEKDFKASELSGYEWVIKPILLRSTKKGAEENERLQLRLTFKKSDKTSFESRYIVGGRLATADEVEFIEGHLRPTYSSAKQSDKGISNEEQVMCRNYKVANFVSVGKSDVVKKWWEDNIK
jgi:hypothetical protein